MKLKILFSSVYEIKQRIDYFDKVIEDLALNKKMPVYLSRNAIFAFSHFFLLNPL